MINRKGSGWTEMLTGVPQGSSVVEPEPELEPEGARNFGRSRSWSRYTEVSAPAPGQTKVVYLIIISIEYRRIKN